MELRLNWVNLRDVDSIVSVGAASPNGEFNRQKLRTERVTFKEALKEHMDSSFNRGFRHWVQEHSSMTSDDLEMVLKTTAEAQYRNSILSTRLGGLLSLGLFNGAYFYASIDPVATKGLIVSSVCVGIGTIYSRWRARMPQRQGIVSDRVVE